MRDTLNVRDSLFLAALLLLSLSARADEVVQGEFLEYRTFQELAASQPNLKEPRLANLTDDAQALWRKGELKVPSNGIFLTGDFDQNGKSNTALLLRSAEDNFLLVSERGKNRWRSSLIAIDNTTAVQWNGRALQLGSNSFVAWEGGKFKRYNGPLALYVFGYTDPDLRGTVLRLDYSGPTNKPFPALVIASFYAPLRTVAGSDPQWTVTLPIGSLRAVLHQFLIASAETNSERRGADRVSFQISIADAYSSYRPNEYKETLPLTLVSSALKRSSAVTQAENLSLSGVLTEYSSLFGADSVTP